MEVQDRLINYYYSICAGSEHVSLLSRPATSSPSPEKISFQFGKCNTEYIFDAQARSFTRAEENHEILPVILPDFSVNSVIVEIGNADFHRRVSESLEKLAVEAEEIRTLTDLIIANMSALKQEHSAFSPKFRLVEFIVTITRVDYVLLRASSGSVETGMRGSVEELTDAQAHHGMVPASEILTRKMLKRVTATGIQVQEESEIEECAGGCKRRRISRNRQPETCMICMEAMKVGSRATKLPCSHLFHTNCVNNWLRTSHYCPLCRFEFPVDDTV